VICNFTFGLDTCKPKEHCVCLFSQGKGELSNHCPTDNVTIQYPILNVKNFDAMAKIFHAVGFMIQLSQAKGLHWSQQVYIGVLEPCNKKDIVNKINDLRNLWIKNHAHIHSTGFGMPEAYPGRYEKFIDEC
jgi:hypothetical protein